MTTLISFRNNANPYTIKIYGDQQIGFVFIPRVGDYNHLKLLGIRHFCRDDGLVLLTPVSTIKESLLNPCSIAKR
jgi:hypothetical protein